jgi:chromosome segregation protein
MRLKSIKLVGFKSFVDPTTVHFPGNMCAIVGPNGCGKSNIIDAVKWVMGESSAKHLRGESMVDVIFNGSSGRKPVGFASIELVFDNTANKLGGAYASYNEISLKRLVTRESQSTYFLNGSKCRRRDITDIFLGTGLGSRSYAIIEQGMISRLIEAKPEELRVYIEEAAGISKYKERRRDTENRMRRTKENMERLNDIREEIDRQLSRLKRQASAAKRYKLLREDERRLKLHYAAKQWQRFNQQLNIHQDNISAQELVVEKHVTELVSVNAKNETLTELRHDKNDELNLVQSELLSYSTEIARLEEVIKSQQQRDKKFNEDRARVESNIETMKQLSQSDSRQLSTLRHELEFLLPKKEELTFQKDLSQQELVSVEEAVQSIQEQWDTYKIKLSAEQRREDVCKSRIGHLESSLEKVQQRMQHIVDEESAINLDVSTDQIDDISRDIEYYNQRLEQSELKRLDYHDSIKVLRASIGESEKKINTKRSEFEKKQGLLSSLEALQQVALGKKDNAVQSWLETMSIDSNARLAQNIDVELKYERAVEIVLSQALQAVCLDDLDMIEAGLSELKKSSLTVIETDSTPHITSQKEDKLINYISTEINLDALIGDVFVVDTLKKALQLRHQLSDHESVITIQGEWVGKNWLKIDQISDEKSGVLARQQEIIQAQQAVAVLKEDIDSLVEKLTEHRSRLIEVEVAFQEVQSEQTSDRLQQSELQSKLSAHNAKTQQIQLRIEKLSHEKDVLQQQFNDEQCQLKNAQESIVSIEINVEEFSLKCEHLKSKMDLDRERLRELKERSGYDNNSVLELSIQEETLKSKIELLVNNIQRMNDQLSKLHVQNTAIQEEQAANLHPAKGNQEHLNTLLEKRLKFDERMQHARQSLNDVEHQLKELEQMRQGLDGTLQQSRSNLEQLRIAFQEVKMRCLTLSEQIDASGRLFDDVIEELDIDLNEEQTQKEIEDVTQKIIRLGPINLAAINEFDVELERKTYLDSQYDDLNSALDTLHNAIKKIDKETKERFKDTFDSVNIGMQELFPKVFGGGQACIELNDSDNLLGSGVVIKASPPGKRNSTIHLLSGGEKALTAIALVFSIFRLNPAPFCMLDEVDAPLDDANVGRYANLVKEMSQYVQFVYISHNKISMEQADQLLGVTMSEPGVSRIVDVNMAKATELALA